MNWIKPTIENHPPFKEKVLAYQHPGKVFMVKLEKIDETGLVFVPVDENQFNIFGIRTKLYELPVVDLYAIIELPTEQQQSEISSQPAQEKKVEVDVILKS